MLTCGRGSWPERTAGLCEPRKKLSKSLARGEACRTQESRHKEVGRSGYIPSMKLSLIRFSTDSVDVDSSPQSENELPIGP